MQEDRPTRFGIVLRQARVAAGLTQEALAERSGLGVRSIQGLERGETQPRPETLRRLTRALQLAGEQSATFERSGQPSPRPRPTVAPVGETARRSWRADTVPHHNLPAQLTSFVGREQEMGDVTRLLAAHRLVTLTGAGGCGKTRLAIKVAGELIGDFPDGIWMVELGPLANADLVAATIAATLGIHDRSGEPITTAMLGFLGPRRVLLLLDNCEHLIDACARLADLILRACPTVQIVATSREALGIAGEVSWRVPSLPVPSATHAAATEDVLRYAAVRLFVDRAAAALPGFALTPQSVAVVAEICARLDGLPLAIELAAARVTGLAPEQIAARLDQRFRLLTGGSRAALPRQQTLAALVGWSYDLLSEPERTFFNRLAVFAGGFTLEAAEAVAGAGDEVAPDALALLLRLVDKSLVVADATASGVDRYRLLETLRHYARERLMASGEADALHEAHAQYYSRLAEEAARGIFQADQRQWFRWFRREHENLRAALTWSIEEKAVERALHLCRALAWFWRTRGYVAEGRGWFQRALSLAASVGQPEPAEQIAWARAVLAALQVGEPPAAPGKRARCEEALAVLRRLGDPVTIVEALRSLGDSARSSGDADAARAAFEEGLALARSLGNRHAIALTLFGYGGHARDQGDLTLAAELARESLTLYHEEGDRWSLSYARSLHGLIALEQGNAEETRRALAESMEIALDLGDTWWVLGLLVQSARLAAAQGHDRRAARLLAASIALVEAVTGLPWDTHAQLRSQGFFRDVSAVRAATRGLSPEVQASAAAEGRAMTLEQAVALALETDGA